MQGHLSKRRQLIVRIIVSIVMTISVIALSTVLSFLMLGYRFNKDQGTITQGGLVQFITTPPGAKVTVGNAKLANVTPSKITLTPGSYDVLLERQGYHTWQKSVSIGAGTVTWLNSARMVPTAPKTSALSQHERITSALFSPESHYLALLPDAANPTIVVETIDRATIAKSTTVTLPTSAYSPGTTHTFTIEKWGRAEQYLLVRHTYDTTTEWLLVDIRDANRTKLIGTIAEAQPTNVLFDPRSNTSVIALYTNGTVYRIETQTGQTTEYPMKNIASFSFISDQSIVYATKPTNGTISTGYFTLDAATFKSIKSFRTQDPAFIAGGKYFSTYYFSIAHGTSLELYSNDSLPRSDSTENWVPLLEKHIDLPEAVSSIKSHANGRFVVVTHGMSQSVYDIERAQFATTRLHKLSAALSVQLEWFDDFNFWTSGQGTLHMYEYDGTNQHDIVAVAEGMPAVMSANNAYLYSIGKTPTGYQIQATRMIIDQ